jgi:hypothetical protein
METASFSKTLVSMQHNLRDSKMSAAPTSLFRITTMLVLLTAGETVVVECLALLRSVLEVPCSGLGLNYFLVSLHANASGVL